MLKFLLLSLTKGIYKKELSDMLELFQVCYYHICYLGFWLGCDELRFR